jgi:hypothetical protein
MKPRKQARKEGRKGDREGEEEQESYLEGEDDTIVVEDEPCRTWKEGR